jgi:hypothetical protein
MIVTAGTGHAMTETAETAETAMTVMMAYSAANPVVTPETTETVTGGVVMTMTTVAETERR